MALKEAEMHALSLLGTGILTAAFFVPVLWLANEREDEGPLLADREVIEATIAYRKTPQKQPQKITAPPPVEKPEGVSRDENKKPEEKKEEKKEEAKPADPKDPFGKFKRDTEEGPATTPQLGDFNGNEKGFAPESKGDPYWGRLRGDMNFQFPEIAKASSFPVGCIQLQPDGKIPKYTFDPPHGQKGDDDLQTAAEASLRNLQKIRNANPEPVPAHLLKHTTRFLCFKFTVESQ